MTMADFGQCLCTATLGALGCLLVSACAATEHTVLQRKKTDLEIQKLELEVAKLRRDRAELVSWFTGISGLLVGAGGTAVSFLVARKKRLGELDQVVHEKRLEIYPHLVSATMRLALYFPQVTTLRPEGCHAMGEAMRKWYFDEGGLLLSTEARDAYFDLARGLTRASLVNELAAPSFPEDAEMIGVKEIGDYKSELKSRLELNNVDRWSFGHSDSTEKTAAVKFKDFVFLQELSSKLRTRLTEDLRSRRRPS